VYLCEAILSLFDLALFFSLFLTMLDVGPQLLYAVSMSDTILAIDFGTSHSLVGALHRGKRVEAMPIAPCFRVVVV
jgi:hypothetical protein